jgi:hypothetical protein
MVRAKAQRRPGCQRRKSWCRRSCHPCPDHEGGFDGPDDGGPAAGDETAGDESAGDESVGVGVGVGVGVDVRVGLVQDGEDPGAGDWSDRAGAGDDDSLVGVGPGDLVVDFLVDLVADGATGQAGTFVLV